MEFRINVYNGQTIEKTYVANKYNLMMGTAEDILALIDIDKLSGNLNSNDAEMEIFKIVLKSFKTFGQIIHEIFPELTEDEYRRVPVKEVARVIMQVLTHTLSELSSVSEKN